MSAGLPKRDNILLLCLPFGERGIGCSKAGKEYVRAIAAPQGGSAEIIDDDKVSVDVIDLCGTLNKDGSVQISPHKLNSPNSKPEQSDVEPEKLNAGNTLLTVIDGRATGLRRTDGTISSFGFRNDNDNFDPLEAC